MDMEARRKADQDITKRKFKEKLKGKKRIPRAIIDELDMVSEEEDLRRKMRMSHMRFAQESENMDDGEYDQHNFIDREDIKGNLGDWLDQPHVCRYIQIVFQKFIKNYKDQNGQNLYEARIIAMCESNQKSLEVNFNHLSESSRNLGMWLIGYPKKVLPILDNVAYTLTSEIFPNYKEISTEIFVRFRELPVRENLRDLRSYQLESLLCIRGVVTKRSSVLPQLKKVFFLCKKCGDKKGPYFYNGIQDSLNLGSCVICQSYGAFELDTVETIYRNYQKLTVQESPGSVPPGRIPRHKEVILTNSLVDTVRPGDEVDVTGIYTSTFDMSTNIKHGFPVFSTYIETNHIKKLNEMELTELTEEDKIDIKKLSKNSNIANMIFDSIAPSIYGNHCIKRALAIAMFGGVPQDISGKHKIRGDINVLLLGDPGTAKSQFLKYCQQAFHRSVYTTGKGASAVGLTAGVHKDPITREWTLEGGALVLSDQGICMIDEFDKMNDQDRTSIHEAMEQQSISISKAGIVTTLQARCSVIAAANPIKGRNKLKYFYLIFNQLKF
jgi:DNA replication licensing factor MCM2